MSDWYRDELDARLVDGYQRGLPVGSDPYAEIATELDVSPETVVNRVSWLRDRGVIRRVGPVLDPRTLGASTLAALRVPDDRVESVARTVNEHRQVTHNYQRDHEWALWFVVTARSADALDEVLAVIAADTGYEPLRLPVVTEYATDLDFPVGGEPFPDTATALADPEPAIPREPDSYTPSDPEARLLLDIQDGLPPGRYPYRTLASRHDTAPTTVCRRVRDLQATGAIKRLGLVVSHHATGFTANTMLAWNVPSGEIDTLGARLGGLPFVTKCYHRPRRPERDWPYTLFTMIHGRRRDAVDRRIAALREAIDHPVARLDTVGKFKQTGTRYESLVTENR